MKGPKALFERDEEIDKLTREIVSIVKKKRLEKDRKGQWFANSQLNDLRKLMERQGYKVARTFQVGKIDKKDNHWEVARNESLLEILDLLDSKSSLDVVICSYIIGKLNPIIEKALEKGEKRNE